MQKISKKSQNLSKISGFKKGFKIEILHHMDQQKIDITCLILKIERTQILHASIILIIEKNIFCHQGLRATFWWTKIWYFQKKLLGGQHLLNLVLWKVKKFEGFSYHVSWAIAILLRGALWGPPWDIGLKTIFLVLETGCGRAVQSSDHTLTRLA